MQIHFLKCIQQTETVFQRGLLTLGRLDGIRANTRDDDIQSLTACPRCSAQTFRERTENDLFGLRMAGIDEREPGWETVKGMILHIRRDERVNTRPDRLRKEVRSRASAHRDAADKHPWVAGISNATRLQAATDRADE